MNRKPQPQSQEDFLLDVTNLDELVYIATKFGCNVSDVLLTVNATRSNHRTVIYSLLKDFVDACTRPAFRR